MTIEFSHKAKQLFLPFRLRVVDTSFQLDTLLTPNANCEKKNIFHNSVAMWISEAVTRVISHTKKGKKTHFLYIKIRVGRGTTLLRQRDHVFRPQNCALLHYVYIL